MEKSKGLANFLKMPKITISDLLGVTVGSAIAAVAIRLFLDPCDIVPGGVSGLSMGVERLTNKLIYKYFGDKDIPTFFIWIKNVLTIQWLNLIFNVPLFIFGAKLLGKKMAILTLLAIVELTVVLAIVPKYALVNDIMLNSIFGGITVGMGLGLVFRYGATTGGTDLAGAILNHRWPNFSIAKGMALVDLFIVAFIGIVTEKVEVSMYSLIAVYFCMKLADMMLDNFGYQKGFFIVSNKPQEIATALMNDLGRGVTLLKGEGMYSKQDRPVLLCVVSRSQFVRAKKIIQDVDASAFIMVSDMSEVLGEGFKEEKRQLMAIRAFIGGSKVFLLALLPPLFFSFFFVLCFTFLPESTSPYSFAIYDRGEKLLCASLSTEDTYHLPLSSNVNEYYKNASIIYEDRAFFLHFGLDFSSIVRAFFLNIKNQKVVSGASTITMQVARLLCKNEKRSYLQKMKESLFSFLLEFKYTKEEIFSLYASNAPFGGNVVGIDAASFRYFSTSQENLSLSQIAVLAVLPNQPSLVTLSSRRERLKEKRDELIKRLYQYAIIDAETYDLSLAEPLPEKPSPLPFLAMHYHDFLKMNKKLKSKNGKYITTIDYNLQQLVEDMTERHSQRLKENLIYNMAVVILEVETGKEMAYVGNTGFFKDNGKNIYVDMARARRSSGSLLKPFLFASMLDRGMIFPQSLLVDVPTQIQNYAPENNSGKYEGAVEAREALTKSLNIPFVRALREYGIPPFLDLLKRCGFTTFNRKPEEYGLPLILGGGEITLYEACSVYAKLMRCANGTLASDESFPISQGAAYLTLDELTRGKRPFDEAFWQSFVGKQKIAWKTGTSDGYKDAWSIGLTPKYVVGVWAGNADGVGRPEIKSNIATLPLMFELFNVLEKSSWIVKPEYSLKRCPTCSHSHYSKGIHCEPVMEEELPINAPLPKICPYCSSVCLTLDRKYRVEASEMAGNERIENWFILSPFIETFYTRNHKQYKTLPPFLNKTQGSSDFEIIFPESNSIIEIPIELSGDKGAFTAKVAHKNQDAILYWDIDGLYLGKTKTFHQFDITLPSGYHILTVTDDGGNSKNVGFYVK